MDDIKQAVVQTLEKQGVIAQLKAQLRAQVFLAVEEYDSASSGLGLASKTNVPARNALLSDGDGQIAIQLVWDLLETCNFVFTKRVFQPELGSRAPEGARQAAAQVLGLKPSSPEEPLLITLLKTFKTGPAVRAVNTTTPSASGPSAVPRPTDSSVAAPTTATGLGSQPAAASMPSSNPALALPSRAGAPPAPLPRLEPLGKPSLGPLPQLGLGAPASKLTESPAAPATSKPQPAVQSAADTGYDDDFEDVEEDVEDDVDSQPAVDDDDDIAAALGCTTITGTSSKGAADGGGKERRGGSLPSSSRGRTALDPDLMIGDRSCGVSQELAGLDAGNSGGLSYSTDFPGGDARASLSSSQAMLSPIFEGSAKLAKLEPLRPTVSGKLSPLAPLPSISSSLSSSREDPLGVKGGPKPLAPLGAPVRKSLPDIEKEKEELRRLGLLQSGDSLNNSIEVESRPRPVGAPSNIYDAEMSVSASMDDGNWAIGGGGVGREEKPSAFGNIKGISMDLGATGLSASDRSGDIEHMGVDFAETAEWH